jgi:hypothetical protein
MKISPMKIILFLLIFFFFPLPFYIPEQKVMPSIIFITNYMIWNFPDEFLSHVPTFFVDFILSYVLSSLLSWVYKRMKFLLTREKKK